MKAQIQKLFADWTVEQAPPEFPKARPSNPADAGVYVATKKDATQTYIAVGQLGVLLNDKDYAAFAIMAGILGGGSNNRLTQHLRARAPAPGGAQSSTTWSLPLEASISARAKGRCAAIVPISLALRRKTGTA